MFGDAVNNSKIMQMLSEARCLTTLTELNLSQCRLITDQGRDSIGISELALFQLILQGKKICIRGSLEIPLQSLDQGVSRSRRR